MTRRVNWLILGALLSTSLVGCDRRTDDASGGRPVRVDAGGHRLEVWVEGINHGQPTVILESGFGGTIDTWSAVRRALADQTRVVSYHRAGMAGSQPGPLFLGMPRQA